MNIVMIISSVMLNCIAQLLMRKGMLQVGEVDFTNLFNNLGNMISNLWLWGAMLCYILSILLWVAVLSKVEVSFAYPFSSLGFVVAAVIGFLVFHEHLSPLRIAGIIVICVGCYLIYKS